jgi:hypothetical protein
MDEAARRVVLRTLAWADSSDIACAFFEDRCFANATDYIDAVEEVWGPEPAHLLRAQGSAAVNSRPTVSTRADQRAADNALWEALLLNMPEPDFRTAIAIASRGRGEYIAPKLNHISKMRRIPWEFVADEGYRWVGDEEVEAHAMQPAQSAIEDPRFTGVKSEFDAARAALAEGTPISLKRCVHEAGCAVEAAMKSVLSAHGDGYAAKDSAFKLWELLVAAGRIDEFMRGVVLGAAWARNERGGHGAEIPHDVPPEMAEAVLASAAVAISYLHTRLPA